MILVLASKFDKAAAAFAEANAAASLFTCYDLAVSQNSLRFPDFENSSITVNKQKTFVKEISGVINLLPAIFPDELYFYPVEEREYQSSEFHALITFFLSMLKCPVINRPSTMSLSGPFINPMSWFHAALQAGIPLSEMTLESTILPETGEENNLLSIEYLGGKIIEPSATVDDDHTIRLAKETGVEYLKAFFDGEKFVKAQTIPDVKDPKIQQAILSQFKNTYYHSERSEESHHLHLA